MSFQKKLPKDDLLKILETIQELNNCESRNELKAVVRTYLFDLFDCSAVLYGWLDKGPSTWKPIDCIGQTRRDLNALKKFVFTDPSAKWVFDKEVNDTVISQEGRQKIEVFEKGNKAILKDTRWEVEDYFFLKYFKTGAIMRDPTRSTFGIGLYRLKPKHNQNKNKDDILVDLLAPHIIGSMKSILVSEEIREFNSFIKVAMDRPEMIALVREDGNIIYCNPAFQKIFNTNQGYKIPSTLEKVFISQIAQFSRPFDINKPKIDIPQLKIDKISYRLQISHLKEKLSGHRNSFYFEISPIGPLRHDIEDTLTEKGLSPREIEVCYEVVEGKSVKQIAESLFISTNTVRTHLQKIHDKLDTRKNEETRASRLELAIRLKEMGLGSK